MNLKDKKILITGATGGIGYSLVKKFYELGSVVLATGTNENKLDQLKNEFKKIKVKSFKLDQHSEIEKFIESCNSELGSIDVLINKGLICNAAYYKWMFNEKTDNKQLKNYLKDK